MFGFRKLSPDFIAVPVDPAVQAQQISDIAWQTPAQEPPMSRRAWRNLDRQITAELKSIDADLSAWAGWEPKTEAVDQLLDERLRYRPRDVMDTWPATSNGGDPR